MSTLSGGPNVVMDGLVLWLDAANPKSYVSGSTTWNDISRSQLNGTIASSYSYSSSFGGGISFAGNNTMYVPFVLDTSTNFTIEVVAKCNTMITEQSPQNRQTVWSFISGSSQGYQLLDLEVWNDGITSINGDNTNFTGPLTGNFFPIGANNIKVYTLSKSGTSQSWYFDSVFRGSVTQTYTGLSQYFKLGSRGPTPTGIGQPWNGAFYSAKIYNRALSAQEVLQNYNAVKSRFGLT
jgi:hypothetical protein